MRIFISKHSSKQCEVQALKSSTMPGIDCAFHRNIRPTSALNASLAFDFPKSGPSLVASLGASS
jgi:hypothetical protein